MSKLEQIFESEKIKKELLKILDEKESSEQVFSFEQEITRLKIAVEILSHLERNLSLLNFLEKENLFHLIPEADERDPGWFQQKPFSYPRRSLSDPVDDRLLLKIDCYFDLKLRKENVYFVNPEDSNNLFKISEDRFPSHVLREELIQRGLLRDLPKFQIIQSETIPRGTLVAGSLRVFTDLQRTYLKEVIEKNLVKVTL